MNILDIFVILIILVFGLIAYYKGFIKACIGFLPSLISIIATYILQKPVSIFLRSTILFEKIKSTVYTSMNLENIISNSALEIQTDIINNMNIPEFIKNALLENNNPVVYRLLNVDKIQDYIAGFIANICINIISVIVIYICVFLIARVAVSLLDIFSKLPVVNTFNHILGFTIGALKGIIIIWLLGIIITFFYSSQSMLSLFELLDSSIIAKFFYNNNILLFLILKIFT